MKIASSNHCRAFTLLDGILTAAALFLLLVAIVPMFARAKTRSRINCVNHLKQIGIAFQIWQGDNHGKYPMDVPVSQGGAQELMAAGSVAGCFQVISNELATPKILACPDDRQVAVATNFNHLTRLNISYFIGLCPTNSMSPTVLAGDANLVINTRPVPAGFVDLSNPITTWTPQRHHGFGNILMAGGSVPTVAKMGFTSSPGTCFATHRVVVP